MQDDKSYKELEAEIADLIQKNETLNRQLIKTWRDMIRLADTMMRLDIENKELRSLHHEYCQE